MHRCPYCMKQSESVICPHCGKSADISPNSSMLPVGSVINGGSGQQYQIGAPLGQGGFGITYVGLDCTLGRRVAVKEYFLLYVEFAINHPHKAFSQPICHHLVTASLPLQKDLR